MFKNFNPNMIGLRGRSLADTLTMAAEGGFVGVDFDIREAAALVDAHGLDHVRGMFAAAGVRPGQWSLPVVFRQDDEQYNAGLAELPRLAELGRSLGCTRTCSGVGPGSPDREYAANFEWHVARMRPIAEVLKEHGCRLGIEFIGPKTLRARHPHEFIYTLGGLIDLWEAIGSGNVGVLLDVWHLYTSGGSLDDLDRIGNQHVVAVHVNDAPPGIPRDEQIDNQRTLPMETGVLEIVGFMDKLKGMGYDGPVTAEPFSKRLNDLAAGDPSAAVAETARSMDRVWRAAGLS
jgi:sugar phosphate isomerase/epimerase